MSRSVRLTRHGKLGFSSTVMRTTPRFAQFVVGQAEQRPVRRRDPIPVNSVGHDGRCLRARRPSARFRRLAFKPKAGGCIAAHPLLGARQPMGACGANHGCSAPFFAWGKFQFWSFSRVETSGGIRASLAGRYASALFDLARDQRQIDAVGRSLDALGQALRRFEGFRRAGREPAGQPRRSRQGVRRARAAARARPDHRQLPRRPRPQRPQERSCAPSSARSAASPPSIAARPPPKSSPRGRSNDDQIAALKAQLRARAGRDVTIDATVDPDILGGIVVKLGSQQIDASIRTKLNRLASAMKG